MTSAPVWLNSRPHGGKASFSRVADGTTRVLILGSLPGDISLSRAQYYANPRNQFWRLMGGVIGTDLVKLCYPGRLATLLLAGFGLWDVVDAAERIGSLDSNIRDHRPNPLGDLKATLPSLRAVCFNGAKAAQIDRKQLGDDGSLALVTLPSSSPAHTIPFEHKLEKWAGLKALVANDLSEEMR